MRLQIDFTKPLQQIRDMVRRCVEALNSDTKRQPIRQTLGDRLEEMILADFDRKAGGGTGAGGVTWLPDSRETVKRKHSSQIGVESGRLRRSLQVTQGGPNGEDLTAAFTAPYAEYFDAERTLLPEQFPNEWTAAMEEGVAPWAEKVMQTEIDRT